MQPAAAWMSLHRLLARFPVALSVEAHYITGGLGSLRRRDDRGARLECRLVRGGVQGRRWGSGSRDYLQDGLGLTLSAWSTGY